MIIKSITHLKNSLNVGDKVQVTYHLRSAGHNFETNQNSYKDEVRPVKEVVACNTTGFTLASRENGKWVGRRLKYPKAENCCIENGKLIIMGSDLDNPDNKQPIKWLTIQVVEG